MPLNRNRTPQTANKRYQGFARLQLPGKGERSAGQGMVIQNIAEDETAERQNK